MQVGSLCMHRTINLVSIPSSIWMCTFSCSFSFVWAMSMHHVTHSGPEIVALWVQYWSHMLQGFDISGRGKHLFPYLPQRIKNWRLRVRGRRFAETAAQYPNYRKPRGDCKGGRRRFRFSTATDQHFLPAAKHAGQWIITLRQRKRRRGKLLLIIVFDLSILGTRRSKRYRNIGNWGFVVPIWYQT